MSRPTRMVLDATAGQRPFITVEYSDGSSLVIDLDDPDAERQLARALVEPRPDPTGSESN